MAETRERRRDDDPTASRRYSTGVSGAALILVATWAVYHASLSSPYVYETTRWASDFFRPWQGWRDEAVFAWHYPTRTVTHLSFLAAHAVSVQPWADHGANLLVHSMNIMLLIAVALPTVGAVGALSAAALFALHPIQTEAVAYASSRPDLLVVSGVLLACLGMTVRRGGLLLLSAGMVIAGLSKETGLMALPLALLWSHQTGGARPSRRVLLASLGICALIFAGLVRQFGWLIAGPDEISAHLAMFARLLWLICWPVGQSIDHAWGWITPKTAAFVTMGWIAALWWIWLHPRRWLGFGLLWALLAVLPRLLAHDAEPLHEHHLYGPMVGMSLALPLALVEWWAPALGTVLYWLRATKCALVGHAWVLPQRHRCMRCRLDASVSDPRWLARRATALRLRLGSMPPSCQKES